MFVFSINEVTKLLLIRAQLYEFTALSAPALTAVFPSDTVDIILLAIVASVSFTSPPSTGAVCS